MVRMASWRLLGRSRHLTRPGFDGVDGVAGVVGGTSSRSMKEVRRAMLEGRGSMEGLFGFSWPCCWWNWDASSSFRKRSEDASSLEGSMAKSCATTLSCA